MGRILKGGKVQTANSGAPGLNMGAGPVNEFMPFTGVFGSGAIKFFNSSGAFLVPAGCASVRVRLWGGGGQSGGGGGGFAMKTITSLTPGETVAVTVAVAGGTSSFGAYVSATGGVANGGAGGSGSGGDINYAGGAGANPASPLAGGGGGVASVVGNGGNGGAGTSGHSAFGAGGGGGSSSDSANNFGTAGGAGLTGKGGTSAMFGSTVTPGPTATSGEPMNSEFSVDFIGTGGGGGGSSRGSSGDGANGGGGGSTANGGFPGGGGGSYGAGAPGLVVVEW